MLPSRPLRGFMLALPGTRTRALFATVSSAQRPRLFKDPNVPPDAFVKVEADGRPKAPHGLTAGQDKRGDAPRALCRQPPLAFRDQLAPQALRRYSGTTISR